MSPDERPAGGVGAPGEPPALGRLKVRVARELASRTADIGRAMSARLAGIDDITPDQQLRGLLEGSVTANLELIWHMVIHHLDPTELTPPPGAVVYAERLAQRGIGANALVRAYHMGQDDLRDHVYQALELIEESSEVKLQVLASLTDDFYRYIDHVTLELLDIYEAEQARWNTAAGNVASAVLHSVLAGHAEGPRLQAETGYVLEQHHVGLVCWSDELNPLRGIQEAVRSLAGGEPLFSAVDQGTAWVWLPRGRSAEPLPASAVAEAMAKVPGGRATVGLTLAGADGFRQTHHQAQTARELALSMADPADVVGYGDPGVAVVSMLSRDPDGARAWVRAVLGPLAVDTDANARLRETLLAWLEARGSYTAVAERLTLHRNTVRYRIERAAHIRGRALDADPLDLETALLCAHFLGRRVLAHPDSSAPSRVV